MGLKWSAIDFQSNTITIKHTVTSCNLNGKHVQVAQDTTKTKSSLRILPLVPAFREKLLEVREYQKECQCLCGKCYNKQYLEYICVDEMGNLISPHYLTTAFPKLLEKNGLRRIRFHDVRHPYALNDKIRFLALPLETFIGSKGAVRPCLLYKENHSLVVHQVRN